jgi:uroporphyrinogen-III synthase
MPDLNGKVVAFLEGRRTAELASLIERHNGVPLAAPCLREVHRPDAPELQGSVARVCDAELGVAIFLTGVGATTVFEAARLMGRQDDLRARLSNAIVVVRGPKPSAVLNKLGVRIDLTAPPPNTSAEVLAALEPVDLRGKTVALQLYGEPNAALSQALRTRGAEVLELAPYLWDQPVDPAPILRLLGCLERREVDALLITSQAQVENLFTVAHDHGRTPELRRVAVGVQGPVAEAALERHGLHAAFRPAHGHMGALVLAAAAHFKSLKSLNNRKGTRSVGSAQSLNNRKSARSVGSAQSLNDRKSARSVGSAQSLNDRKSARSVGSAKSLNDRKSVVSVRSAP